METKISKIEQSFEFQTGEIYLLNNDVEIDNGFEIITYKCGTPVKFIRKDNEETATLMDSDMKLITVSIDFLTDVPAIKLSRRTTQFANYIIKYLYNYGTITAFAMSAFAAVLMFMGMKTQSETHTVTFGNTVISLIPEHPLICLGYIVVGFALFIFLAMIIVRPYGDETAISGFNKNRKGNLLELKKMKSVNIDAPHKNFTAK